jgi:hypothetical protein
MLYRVETDRQINECSARMQEKERERRKREAEKTKKCGQK